MLPREWDKKKKKKENVFSFIKVANKHISSEDKSMSLPLYSSSLANWHLKNMIHENLHVFRICYSNLSPTDDGYILKTCYLR